MSWMKSLWIFENKVLLYWSFLDGDAFREKIIIIVLYQVIVTLQILFPSLLLIKVKSNSTSDCFGKAPLDIVCVKEILSYFSSNHCYQFILIDVTITFNIRYVVNICCVVCLLEKCIQPCNRNYILPKNLCCGISGTFLISFF